MHARQWTIAAAACALLPAAGAAQTGAGVEIERRQSNLHPSLKSGGALKLEAVDIYGGLNPGLSAIANLDLLFDIDTERAGWWRGGRFHLFVLANAGSAPSPTERAGDLQTIRNLEAPDDFKLYEAYLEQSIGDRTSLIFGLHDANTAFGDMATAALFHHSSFGIQPDVAQAGLSIFPSPTLGAVLIAELPRNFLLETGIYDGVPGDPAHPRGTRVKLSSADGVFSIAQLTWRPAGGIAEQGTDWAIAGWYHTATSAAPSGRDRGHNRGAFSTYERHLGAKYGGNDLSVFAQAGWAAGDANPIERYFGAGLVWSGLHPPRGPARSGAGQRGPLRHPAHCAAWAAERGMDLRGDL